jgi:hypothetical protein
MERKSERCEKGNKGEKNILEELRKRESLLSKLLS